MEKNEYQTKPASNDLIIAHMATIQGLITRFAGNSAACKNMCLTLVAAILALLTANKDPQTLKIAYTVTGLMAWMDAYYLSMERMVVELSKECSKKIQTGAFANKDLYDIRIGRKYINTFTAAFSAFTSHSIWPFYGGLFACLLVIQFYFSSFVK
jgi:glucan phosphoethanolaminetransferase (alkaline phosphatase superfamily)